MIKRLLGIPRGLTAEELEQVQRMNALVNGEKYKMFQIKGNTARFANKNLLKDQEALVNLLENGFSEFMGQLLGQLGYPKGMVLSLDLRSGKVMKQKVAPQVNEPRNEPRNA